MSNGGGSTAPRLGSTMAAVVAYPGALASFDDKSVLGIVAVACTKGEDARAAGLEHGVLL